MPELRFPEFSGEWEEKKFKDFVKLNQGLQIAISNRFLEDGPNRYFYITNEFLKENSDKEYYIENPPKNVICNQNDILMTRTGNTGQVVTDVSGAFHNNFFRIKYDSKNMNKKFLYYILNLHKTQNKILRLAGTSTIPDLNHGDFYNIDINLPSFTEQEKIASFLSKVDEKIEKLEKKQELWETYKKGMMQKIFSQELRFKDENGEDFPDWEDKSMISIGKFYKGSNLSKDDLTDSGFPCILYGDLFTIYDEVIIDVKKFINNSNENLFLGKKGDLLIPSSTTVDAWSIACSSALMVDNVALGGDLNVWRPKIHTVNSIFISYQINQSAKRDIAKLAQGTTIVHLYNQQLKNVKLKIPNIGEQEKIANLMVFIDFKIKTIKENVEITKEFKKGLLQKMFC